MEKLDPKIEQQIKEWAIEYAYDEDRTRIFDCHDLEKAFVAGVKKVLRAMNFKLELNGQS